MFIKLFPANNQDPLLASSCFQLLDHLCPPNVLTSWPSLGNQKHVDWSLLTFPWQQRFGILSIQTQRQPNCMGHFRLWGIWAWSTSLHSLTRRRSHKTWKHVDLSLLSFPLRRFCPFCPYMDSLADPCKDRATNGCSQCNRALTQ